jgi:diphthamide synthase (EF-2-diphthine--ammonia ligase)
MIEKILLCWSGGKDSAFALHELQKSNQFKVAALITTVTEGYDRVSMHGVRRILLQQQSAALGIPLEQVVISQQATNEEYGTKMQALLESYLLQGITKVAFGDLFLEDLRKYREKEPGKDWDEWSFSNLEAGHHGNGT